MANGFQALYRNTEGSGNTANGFQVLFNNTTGESNTAIGSQALFYNTEGVNNTATEIMALAGNTSGINNTANGWGALNGNTTGARNTAVGVNALLNNNANENTAVGFDALQSNTTGDQNMAIGRAALQSNITGSANTAVGWAALINTTGGANTALGAGAGQNITGNGNVCIGLSGDAGVDNTTWIRNLYDSVATARQVYVTEDNKIGTLSSSRRYKEEIKPMDTASETLFALKPVTFRYKKEIDRSRALSFGLIAEEVANISPDLITRDEEGQPQTVRYEAINAMLLNEFLKEHRNVEQLKNDFQAKLAQQQKEIETLTAQLKEQAAQIQKVSAHIEISKFATGRIRRGGRAPQLVLNER